MFSAGQGQNFSQLPAALQNRLLWLLKCCCPGPRARTIFSQPWRRNVCRKWRLGGGGGAHQLSNLSASFYAAFIAIYSWLCSSFPHILLCFSALKAAQSLQLMLLLPPLFTFAFPSIFLLLKYKQRKNPQPMQAAMQPGLMLRPASAGGGPQSSRSVCRQ